MTRGEKTLIVGVVGLALGIVAGTAWACIRLWRIGKGYSAAVEAENVTRKAAGKK